MACRLMLYIVPDCENEIKVKLVKAPCVQLCDVFMYVVLGCKYDVCGLWVVLV